MGGVSLRVCSSALCRIPSMSGSSTEVGGASTELMLLSPEKGDVQS